MNLQEYLSDGRFWMRLWVGVFALSFVWGVLTVFFWLDSVRNLNLISVVALVLAGAAGVQATLGMRKADPKDPL
jgi:hypothetical protein